MKRHRLFISLMLSVVAAALGAVAASPAAAVEFLLAEWLLNGVALVGELSLGTEGELELEDSKVPLVGKAKIKCSMSIIGLALPNGEGTFEVVFNLQDTEISKKELEGLALTCNNVSNCPEPLLWFVHLNWKLLLELMEDGASFFAVLILPSTTGLNPGWEVECMGDLTSDTCTFEQGVFEAKSAVGTVDATFSEAFTLLSGLEAASCTLGGGGAGIIEGLIGMADQETTNTLSVSSEG